MFNCVLFVKLRLSFRHSVWSLCLFVCEWKMWHSGSGLFFLFCLKDCETLFCSVLVSWWIHWQYHQWLVKGFNISKMSKGKVNNLSMCLDISSVKRNACSTLIQLSHCFSVKSSFNANEIGFRTHRQSLMTKSMIHIQTHVWFVMHMHLKLTVDFCFNQWLILVTLCSKIKISL